MRFPVFAVLLLAGVYSLPAQAGNVLYTTGAYNGTVDSWDLSNTYDMADSFNLTAGATLNSVGIVVWANPGDTLTSLSWAILSDPTGAGTTYASGTAPITQSYIGGNIYGYDLDTETFSIPQLYLGPGNYWLQLSASTVTCASAPTSCYSGGANDNNYIWWDENDNASSQAWDSIDGYENPTNDPANCASASCSETFTISGTAAPEPDSFSFMMAGALGLALFVKRRFAR